MSAQEARINQLETQVSTLTAQVDQLQNVDDQQELKIQTITEQLQLLLAWKTETTLILGPFINDTKMGISQYQLHCTEATR